MEKVIKNEIELARLAQDLASKVLVEETSIEAKVIGLVGELGTGKTTFAKYFLAALGVEEEVLSPTFILMKNYVLNGLGFKKAVHADCYRLDNPVEALRGLGFEKILKDGESTVLVEWAERIKDMLPVDTIWVELVHNSGDSRQVKLY